MRILYGICGEGMGHATRSVVIARHLERQGHDLTFASSGRALKVIRRTWPYTRAIGISGVGFVMDKDRVAPVVSVLVNTLKYMATPLGDATRFLEMGENKPEVVITDFEPCSARFALVNRLPLVAVDHIHFVNRCVHPREVFERDREAAAMAYPVVNNMIPWAQRYLIPTFAHAKVCRPDTTLHLPTIRDEIIQLKSRATTGRHVVAYFNEKFDQHRMLGVLAQLTDVEFRVYGVPGQTRRIRHGNLLLCPYSESGFFEDFSSASAIVGGGGFNFMSEAIYLGKPMLSLPFGKHFEQILNANYLELLGYGERCCEFTPQALKRFILRAPLYRERLRSYRHDNNRELLWSVDRAVWGAVGVSS